MRFKSLNSAILSVINPQPKVVKEDYQTRERDRQMANTGQLGSSLDSKEKASKKVYGKDGVVAHKSLRAMIKKANWKDEKNRLAVKEDIQTPERKQEMSGKRKKLEKRFETSAMLPKDVLGIWAHGKKDAEEKKSKQMYGKGGKIVKKTTVKEEQDLSEDLPPKSYVDRITKQTKDARDAAMKAYKERESKKKSQTNEKI